MTSSQSTAVTTVNTTALGGNQDGAVTVALAGGGYVTAWNTDLTGNNKDVVFQRFDAAGNAVGGPVTANATTTGDQVLTDIVATADGNFTLAWTKGTTVTTRSFDGAAGAATSAEINTVVLQALKENGESVRRGDLLVRLDDTAIRDGLASAEAASRAALQASR